MMNSQHECSSKRRSTEDLVPLGTGVPERRQWFFHTREGVDVGPYESQFEAEIEAGMLKELLRERASKGDGCMAVIREFVLDSYAMGRPLTPNFSQAAHPAVNDSHALGWLDTGTRAILAPLRFSGTEGRLCPGSDRSAGRCAGEHPAHVRYLFGERDPVRNPDRHRHAG